jgi:glucose/arabinose dehydrogenase
MAFGLDGTLYVVTNQSGGRKQTQAVIYKGVASASGGFTWTILASTEPYPMSGTPFDHLFNGVVVSPDGQWVFVNSGSRTDHGEVEDNGSAFQDTREIALTSKIFRIPVEAVELVLPNDEDALAAQGLIFARGTRNAYDLEFAPNGDLFVGDNGPDADYPDELNWIREGLHYGFPWRFGDRDNPQQFTDYNGLLDRHLQSGFTAVDTGTYRNDPGFPEPPASFTAPVANLGPDAAQYRGDDGKPYDAAAEGKPLYTFTPHRSPLGLVFATDPRLPDALRGAGDTLSALILSWGAAGGTLSDKGQDLLHLTLTKRGDNYEAVTEQIARGFNNPIDAVMIENRLYVLEYGEGGAIWELTFELGSIQTLQTRLTCRTI